MTTSEAGQEAAREQRLKAHAAVSAELACSSTDALLRRVQPLVPAQAGTGGAAARLTVAAQPVFMKLVPLSALEMQPAHQMSTANLFGLPAYYQYGIGSLGFGAWRELALHQLANGWVTSGACERFPLLHHWRVLPALPCTAADEPDFFAGDAAPPADAPRVHERVAAARQPAAHLALFLECFPQDAKRWLRAQVAQGGAAGDAAVAFVEAELEALLGFLYTQGVVHFDAHFDNMLTDGWQLVLSDFGLASCTRFELDDAERAFLQAHGQYDRWRSAMALVHAIVTGSGGDDAWPLFVRGQAWPGSASLGPVVRQALDRLGPVALLMRDFSRALVASKHTPYPAQQVAQALAAAATVSAGGL